MDSRAIFKRLMSIIDFVKQLIKHKLENGISISIDLPSFYTAPKQERQNENQRRRTTSARKSR